MIRLLPALLLLGLAAAACGDSYIPGEDDDDSAAAELCEAADGPMEITFSGELDGAVVFDPPTCSLDGSTWTAVWAGEDAWTLTLTASDLVEGELLTEGVVVELDDGAGAVYSAGDGLNTLDVQRYQPPGAPCGVWTVNALDAPAGGFVTVSPQPAPLRCD